MAKGVVALSLILALFSVCTQVCLLDFYCFVEVGMSGPKTPVAKLPREKTFFFKYFSEVEQEEFSGTFVIRRPNVIDQARIEVEKSHTLDGYYHDESNPGVGIGAYANNLAEVLAFFKVLCTKAPDWWSDEEVFDVNLLMALYKEAQSVDPFRGGAVSDASDDSSSGKASDPVDNDAEPGDVLAQMVRE